MWDLYIRFITLELFFPAHFKTLTLVGSGVWVAIASGFGMFTSLVVLDMEWNPVTTNSLERRQLANTKVGLSIIVGLLIGLVWPAAFILVSGLAVLVAVFLVLFRVYEVFSDMYVYLTLRLPWKKDAAVPKATAKEVEK